MVNPLRLAGLGVLAAGLLAGAAAADPSAFLGNWANGDAGEGGFFSRLIGSEPEDAAVSRVVVTQAGATTVRIHLYGKCNPECDWGTQLGHLRSEAPDSAEVRSISADFTTGKAVKHLTLRQGAGRTLRFDLATDFNDHSGPHDYEVSGSLRFVPPPPAPVASTPDATPVVAAAPAAPPVTSYAPAAPAAPAALAAADIPEDCVKINPETVFYAPSGRGWKAADFDHTIVEFGPDKKAAATAIRVLEFYRFDEQCYIARPKAKMIYWRVAGQFPRERMPGDDCVDLNPQAIVSKDGKVLDGTRTVIDFDGDDGLAAQAAAVIRSYRLNKQCFVSRPSDKMVYWLSQ